MRDVAAYDHGRASVRKIVSFGVSSDIFDVNGKAKSSSSH
jgi:hypothetical protein